MDRARRLAWRSLAYGLVLLPSWLVVLFIGSLFVDPERHSMNVGNPFVAVVLGAVSYLLARRVRVEDRRGALTLGLAWAGMLAGFALLIAVPNGTTGRVFGAWTASLVFLAIAAAPLVEMQMRKTQDASPRPPVGPGMAS